MELSIQSTVSNGSSVMSDYSSVGNEENVDRSKRIVTTETTTVLTKRVTDDQQPQQQEDSFIFERNRYHGSKAVEDGERSKRENILGDEQQQQQHLDQKQVDRKYIVEFFIIYVRGSQTFQNFHLTVPCSIFCESESPLGIKFKVCDQHAITESKHQQL